MTENNRYFKKRKKKFTKNKKEEVRQVTEEPKTKECPFCFSEINYRATKCPHCTSNLVEDNKE